jgi:hypothetical protein
VYTNHNDNNESNSSSYIDTYSSEDVIAPYGYDINICNVSYQQRNVFNIESEFSKILRQEVTNSYGNTDESFPVINTIDCLINGQVISASELYNECIIKYETREGYLKL